MEKKGLEQFFVDTDVVDAFNISCVKKMTKLRLILLPSDILKLLALHNAGCHAIDSVWMLEHELVKLDMLEEYTKRLVYARVLWANGDGKLIKMTFVETYLSSSIKQKDCIKEIDRVSKILIPLFRRTVHSEIIPEKAFARYFAEFFFGTFNPKLTYHQYAKKIDGLKNKIKDESESHLYSSQPILLFANLTHAVTDMLNFVGRCDDIDFLFSKIFTKPFSIFLTESNRRDILRLELCYCLSHSSDNQGIYNLNKMIKAISLSMLSGDDGDFVTGNGKGKKTKSPEHIHSLALLHTSADYHHTLSSKPNVKRLDRLLASDKLSEQTVFELIDLTRHFTTWRVGYVRGKLVVDGERSTLLRNISSKETPLIHAAVKTASEFEVMRPFHLSPALAFDTKERDIQRACLFLVMLSTVENMFYVPETDVEGNLVVVSASARESYLPRSTDIHVMIKRHNSPILSVDVLDEVIEALIANEDCII